MIKKTFMEYLTKAEKYESEFRKILAELVKFPTVAEREPQAINDCANSLEDFFKSYGYKVNQYPTTEKGYPVVFAEKNVGAKKTLMFYHHYDVQPEEPLDLWESSPWELVERDGRLFARGTCDDKGEAVISLIAMKMLEDTLGELPVNVKFIMEGEEEAGSHNLPKFTTQHPELMRADGCIWEGALLFPGKENLYTFDTPGELVCGLKGNAYYEITTKEPPYFPRTDVHSGEAAATPNAAWSLVWALNTLKDKNENVLIDGFNELVGEPLEEDIEVLKEKGDDFEKHFKEDYKMDNLLLDRSGLDLLVELSLKPSLSICGLKSGFQDIGSKTIIPAKAMVKLDFRLVPNLTMKKVDELLRKHFEKYKIDYLDIKLIGGYDPAKTSVKHPFVQMIRKVTTEIISPKEVTITPIAYGSGPAYLFTTHTPLCMAGNFVEGLNGHAPNENIPVNCIQPSIAFNAVIAQQLAKE
ncbi:MAG: M20/M25/M40 family metallo-hydrolase [Asgard group archaeon]|nr:M20/M25/M40 family metallo-hydrolase [Asgard group archaeon]